MKGTCVRSHAHDRLNTSVLLQLPKPRPLRKKKKPLKTCRHTTLALLLFVTDLVKAGKK